MEELGCQPSPGVMVRGGARGDLAFPSAFWAVFAPQFWLDIHFVSSPGAAGSLRGAQARLDPLFSSVCHSSDLLLWD